jgi:peptidoglycan/xylan/chitin deacetylase (PgdA/CDA1 family)
LALKSTGLALCGLLVLILSCSLDDMNREDNGSGILLAFDDYHPQSWEENFALLNKYNAKATFFVMLDSPSSFCFAALKRGHEIGYHTLSHPRLPKLSKNEFIKETVSAIDLFKNSGIELRSFAYPYGDWQPWMHAKLLQSYDIVRGFDSRFHMYNIGKVRHAYISSTSVDNIKYASAEKFTHDVSIMLKLTKRTPGSVWPVTAHSISHDKWGISLERLEFLLKTCKELKLRFYLYSDMP